MKAGDRVKTDRRDAMMLAKLHRADELTSVWVPNAAHEAMRGLIRARGWTLAYRRWLTTVRFQHPAQQIVFQDYVDVVADAKRGSSGCPDSSPNYYRAGTCRR